MNSFKQYLEETKQTTDNQDQARSSGLEKLLLKSEDPGTLLHHAKNVVKGRWPEAEPIILAYGDTAARYAVEIIKDRCVKAEPVIFNYSKSFMTASKERRSEGIMKYLNFILGQDRSLENLLSLQPPLDCGDSDFGLALSAVIKDGGNDKELLQRLSKVAPEEFVDQILKPGRI